MAGKRARRAGNETKDEEYNEIEAPTFRAGRRTTFITIRFTAVADDSEL